jgi:hypothetical protein
MPYWFNIREGEKTCKINDGKKTVRPSPIPMTIVCKTTTQLDLLSWWHLRMNFNFSGAVNSAIIESMALFFRGRFLRLIRSLDTAEKKTRDSDNQDCVVSVSKVSNAALREPTIVLGRLIQTFPNPVLRRRKLR